MLRSAYLILMSFYLFSDEKVKALKIWYQLEIHSSPGPPADIIELDCIALVRVQ